MSKLREVFYQIIIMNELGGNTRLTYEFSDPDGVRTGKSGYSFGICQFDIENNGAASLCLKECGFSSEEINALKAQTIKNLKPYNAKLKSHAQILDYWDNRQLNSCLSTVQVASNIGCWSYLDDKAFLMAADYHNQFYISKGGKFFNWAKSLGRPISDYDILKYKKNLPWGQKRPDDVQRRYNNVLNAYNSISVCNQCVTRQPPLECTCRGDGVCRIGA